jgi:hypothetical protein
MRTRVCTRAHNYFDKLRKTELQKKLVANSEQNKLLLDGYKINRAWRLLFLLLEDKTKTNHRHSGQFVPLVYYKLGCLHG